MDAFMPVLAAFEKETGIKVDYQIYRAEDLAVLLPAQFDAKTAPGDVIFMWAWFIDKHAENGHVLDMTGYLNEADFIPGALDPVKTGDRLYGGAYTGKVKPGFCIENRSSRSTDCQCRKLLTNSWSCVAKYRRFPGSKLHCQR